MKPKSGQEPWFYLAMCVLLPPLGLYFLWKRSGLPLSLKLGVTILLLFPVWVLQSPRIMESILKRRLRFAEQELDWKSQVKILSRLGEGRSSEAMQYRLHGLSLNLGIERKDASVFWSDWKIWTGDLEELTSEDRSFVETLAERRGPIRNRRKGVLAQDLEHLEIWRQFAHLILKTEPFRLREHLPYLRQLQEKTGFFSEDRLGFWGVTQMVFTGRADENWEKLLKTRAGLDDFRQEEKMVLARYYQLRQKPEDATQLILGVFSLEPLYWDFRAWLKDDFQKYEAFLNPYLQAERARFVDMDLSLAETLSRELAQREWPEDLQALEQENLFNLVVLLRVQKQKPEEALPYLDRLLAFPHALREEEALFHRAMIYLGMEEGKKARQDIARLLNEYPATRYRDRIEVIRAMREIEDKLKSVWHAERDGES